MKRCLTIICFILMVCSGVIVKGQYRRVSDDEEGRVGGMVSAGMGVIDGYGLGMTYNNMNVEIDYKVNENFVLNFGVGLMNQRLMGDCSMERSRDLSPRRRKGVKILSVGGMYKISERMLVAATLFYIDGGVMSYYGEKGLHKSSAIGFQGNINYKLSEKSLLSIYFEYYRVEGIGMMMPYYFGMPFVNGMMYDEMWGRNMYGYMNW